MTGSFCPLRRGMPELVGGGVFGEELQGGGFVIGGDRVQDDGGLLPAGAGGGDFLLGRVNSP